MHKNFLPLLVVFIAGLLFPLAAIASDTVKVRRVLDGNTLQVFGGKTVRLIGVITPSVKDRELNKKISGDRGIELSDYEYYAQKSEFFLRELVGNKKVRVVYDFVSNITYFSEPQQTLLGYVYLDDLLINGEIIREGYGVTDRQRRFKYQDKFRDYEREARAARRKIWSKIPRIQEKENGSEKRMSCQDSGSRRDFPVIFGWIPPVRYGKILFMRLMKWSMSLKVAWNLKSTGKSKP